MPVLTLSNLQLGAWRFPTEEVDQLDSTGRPISDQVHVTETLHRISADELEWSETITDPKIYTQPWQTMKMPLRLQDSHTDVMEYYCSPVEAENYNKRFSGAASRDGK